MILENREFSFVGKPLMRKNTKLQPICQKTLQKYIDLVTVQVEKKSADILPSNLGFLSMDVAASEHFIGIFGCFQNVGFSEKVHLAFFVLPMKQVLVQIVLAL